MQSINESQFRVNLFGRFEVYLNGVSLTPQLAKCSKTALLLKLLLSERGRVFTQDQLLEALFPDTDPDTSSQNLRGRISELRDLISETLILLGKAAFNESNYALANSLFAEALVLNRACSNKWWIARALKNLGCVAIERAASLYAITKTIYEAINQPMDRAYRDEYERYVNAIRIALGEEAFAKAWAAGRAMMLEQAIEYALQSDDSNAEFTMKNDSAKSISTE